jgi:hypothetical protein
VPGRPLASVSRTGSLAPRKNELSQTPTPFSSFEVAYRACGL